MSEQGYGPNSVTGAREASKKEALDAIAVKIAEAESALKEAEAIANEANVTFFWTYEYGMGGRYVGETGEWIASSDDC